MDLIPREADRMRITDLDVLDVETPRGSLVSVTLRTDEGLIGVSDTVVGPMEAALAAYLERVAAPQLRGSDPFETGKIVSRLGEADGGAIGAAAVSLVEVACWDLVGKVLGVPVYRLFGGAVRDRIRALACGWQPSERSADAFASAARRAVARGYRALALEPLEAGTSDPTRAEILESARLGEAVRAAVGPDVEVVLELRKRFPADVAFKIARAFERIAPAWVGDPSPADSPGALARIAGRLSLPVAAGPTGRDVGRFHDLLAGSACDIATIDLMRCGGFTEARTLARMAEAQAVRVVLRNRGGPAATAANLHLAATLGNLVSLEHGEGFECRDDMQGSPPVKNAESGSLPLLEGAFPLPQGPGLCAGLDESDRIVVPGRAASDDPL